VRRIRPCAYRAARPACGKTALRFVELRGGNAEVKQHPVHAVDAQLVQISGSALKLLWTSVTLSR